MLEIYIDGASKGEGGESSVGFVAKNHLVCLEGYAYIGNSTNHVAEFEAMRFAIRTIQTHFPDEILSFRSDSKLVVDTIEKGYTKNKDFLPIYQDIQTLIDAFPFVFIKWIPDTKNKHADRLAKLALRTKATKVNTCF